VSVCLLIDQVAEKSKAAAELASKKAEEYGVKDKVGLDVSVIVFIGTNSGMLLCIDSNSGMPS
jgi:hypothetical protein